MQPALVVTLAWLLIKSRSRASNSEGVISSATTTGAASARRKLVLCPRAVTRVGGRGGGDDGVSGRRGGGGDGGARGAGYGGRFCVRFVRTETRRADDAGRAPEASAERL